MGELAIIRVRQLMNFLKANDNFIVDESIDNKY
jgi:hypothetical protein